MSITEVFDPLTGTLATAIQVSARFVRVRPFVQCPGVLIVCGLDYL